MATTSELSKNSFIRYNNELLKVIEYDHITPGKGNAIYSLKCRNVETGKQSEVRFRSGEKVDIIRVDEYEMQYLYSEGDSHGLIATVDLVATYQGTPGYKWCTVNSDAKTYVNNKFHYTKIRSF
jgi:translation elongation factor P/translation initiation factor 5A